MCDAPIFWTRTLAYNTAFNMFLFNRSRCATHMQQQRQHVNRVAASAGM